MMTSLGLQTILPLRETVMSGSSLSKESLVAMYVTGVGSFVVCGVTNFLGPVVFGNRFGGIFTEVVVGFSFAFVFSFFLYLMVYWLFFYRKSHLLPFFGGVLLVLFS